jgi:4-methyl-5(b-hydroxyethyl)-thiazole monophosphate biosynthesis
MENNMSEKVNVLLLLAEGFEEVESITPITFLRRAGIEVTTVSISGNLIVKGARGVQITADTTLAEITGLPKSTGNDWDAVIIPGGLHGATNLAACEKTGVLLKEMNAAGKLICAICASPAVVLTPLGILSGKKFTCYPGFQDKIEKDTLNNGLWLEDRVVIDGNIITSSAAGTAGEFSIAIIKKLLGEEAAKKTAESVLL